MSEELDRFVHGVFTVSRKSGPNDLMVVCPFHTNAEGKPERTGSMAVSIVTGQWFCHTCGEGGGAKRLLRKLQLPENSLSSAFYDKLDGGPSKGRYHLADPRIDSRCRLDESVLGLFDTSPSMPQAVLDWGFTFHTYRAFDLGYDRRHLRITFPLRDFRGNLVGFSGRTLEDHPARYKVYGDREYGAWGITNAPLREKGKIVWNYDRVSAALMQTYDAPILVVEGFKACMWLVQLGFTNTVALLGSAMSDEQRALLERLGGTLYLFLDNDKAGEKKTQIGERLASAGCDVRIPEYPTKQPDTLKRRQVQQAMREAISIIHTPKEKKHDASSFWKEP